MANKRNGVVGKIGKGIPIIPNPKEINPTVIYTYFKLTAPILPLISSYTTDLKKR